MGSEDASERVVEQEQAHTNLRAAVSCVKGWESVIWAVGKHWYALRFL